jgi:hypothetical protein
MLRNRWSWCVRSLAGASRRRRPTFCKPARRCTPAIERLESRLLPRFAAPIN